MTDTTNTADVIPLRKRPMTGAERQKAYRARKAAAKSHGTGLIKPAVTLKSPVTPRHPVTLHQIMLVTAAIGLAGVGVTMNGWFARSLGSSDVAGWLFLAIGVAADLSALALPSTAARFWRSHQRGAAATGWLVWLMTFAFALTAGIGFASVNISDVTQARASRVTPAVTTAQADLADAVTARDRECKGGVGKFCREREAAVSARQQALDAAIHTNEQAADPQVTAATGMVVWLSHGWIAPTPNDFVNLRLVLLALLPQLGGILLMLGRNKLS